MKIHIADPTGLCFGVRRAISKLEEELLRSGTVYSLGSPIHNPQETDRLTKMGLVVVESAEEVPAASVAFIRAHGVTPLQEGVLIKKCRKVVDGTCPFVKTAQKRAKDLSTEGYVVVISGDRHHPEVKGIMGYVEGEVAVVSSDEDIPDNLKGRRCGILSQTTQKVGSFAALVGSFSKVSPEIKVYNTICKATLARQDSVCRLASKVDGMIILGGRNSANTKKLAEISMDVGVSTLWIEHAGEIDRGWLQNRDDIGIAAGGSTPDWLIKELIQKLNMM
ncbi:MAG TPA: 4-hydroxy-3-methylbut-2-enyl diphosphate reductase [Synergistaceae bacterium]|nr:4-hydroxy-3-methylbut-2-enyl diphosphate reductase [Synergistaceae bacterium]NLL40412.1 4-hydroxy-3-methylbut-2-enyl diphosphate reductase [Synergistaceae bacterium]HPX03068.1 4-hydroxy-3-methylbut-2-enyl diphosphate reductase [Synergistaceae bacterium]HQA54460.1 4-hydroxy-3-methylbut-2-enyl diphosphate reductase [Synergistaceae bacterium]